MCDQLQTWMNSLLTRVEVAALPNDGGEGPLLIENVSVANNTFLNSSFKHSEDPEVGGWSPPCAFSAGVHGLACPTPASVLKTDDTTSKRAISWWSEPLTNGDVTGLLKFAKAHRSIVTTVILECGVLTCVRTHKFGQCTNNAGIGGKLHGNMSEACIRAIPALTKLGIRSEIWLGQDDSPSSARYLFSHAEETASAFIELANKYPGLVGFNLVSAVQADLSCARCITLTNL